MTKAIMISIKPEQAYNIVIGKKIWELRSWVPENYTGWVYVYVSEGEKRLFTADGTFKIEKKAGYSRRQERAKREEIYLMKSLLSGEVTLNGTVFFRFYFSGYDKCEEGTPAIYKNACVSEADLKAMFKGRFYAWHIEHLEIFERAGFLGNYTKRDGSRLTSAPRKMVYIMEEENDIRTVS